MSFMEIFEFLNVIVRFIYTQILIECNAALGKNNRCSVDCYCTGDEITECILSSKKELPFYIRVSVANSSVGNKFS